MCIIKITLMTYFFKATAASSKRPDDSADINKKSLLLKSDLVMRRNDTRLNLHHRWDRRKTHLRWL